MNIPGHLNDRHGPMFASKTIFLVDNLNRYADLGFSTSYINTIKDDRSDNGVSTNCSGGVSLSKKVDKFSVNDLSEFNKHIDKYKVLAIDEFQFFENSVNIVLEWIEQYDKIVYVAGLDLNAKRKKWGSILDLAGQAEDSQKVTAKCLDCLREGQGIVSAPFTSRIDPNGPDVETGGDDKYLPVCRLHWNRHNDQYLI